MSPVHVAVVDDHPLYLLAVSEALADADGVEVVAGCRSFEELESMLAADPDSVDLVLLDLGLPGRGGDDVVRQLARTGMPVVVLSATAARSQVVGVFAAGARGYLTKSAEPEEIIQAVRMVIGGGTYVAPALAPFLAWALQDRTQPPASSLTAREREVLALLAAGATDQEIAARLQVGLPTVRSHLDRIRNKTGARRRAALTRIAVEEGLQGSAHPSP